MKLKKKINYKKKYKKNHKSILVDLTNPRSESIDIGIKQNLKTHRKKSQVNLVNL
jgi:hypothetical protein